MKLSLVSAERLSPVERDEFDQLLARINTVWAVNHDPQTGVERYQTTQSTVGSAGSASAPPANPVRWADVKYTDENGLVQTGVIPIYAKE